MKRYILFLLPALLTAVGSHAQEAFSVGEFTYLPTGAATVSVTGCEHYEGALVIIPESVTHEGTTYTVTAIGERAFSGSSAAAIYMPATVTTIGNGAFGGCAATFIKLSPNLTSIGRGAFNSCNALGNADLPATVETIGENAYSQTPLYTIGTESLPQLTTLGGYALAGTHLRSFHLTDKVTNLGEGVFMNSKLETIQLPASMTELPDNFLDGTNIQHLDLPAGITRIGIGALANTPITQLDLSGYHGSIDMLAFNGCQNLDRIALPADNAHCYTSADGKVLYARPTNALLSVLPTVETLTVAYPETGQRIDSLLLDEDSDGEKYYQETFQRPLNGTFTNLRQLELPHTWRATLRYSSFPQLEELTMRMPAEAFVADGQYSYESQFSNYYPPTIWGDEHPCVVRVFPYVQETLKNNHYWRSLTSYGVTFEDIDRPTEELYMAEVLPMYDQPGIVQDGKAVLYNGDWNAAIEEAFPQYFTAEAVATSRDNLKQSFRDYLLSQYLTPSHYAAFTQQDDEVVKCIDGNIYLATGFGAENYANWYLQQQFTPATGNVPTGALPIVTETNIVRQDFPADPTWGVPTENVSVFSTANGSGNPSAYYALHLVPGVTYDIYAIVPPRHPLSQDATDESEGVEYKNRIRSYLTYVSSIEEGTARTSRLSSQPVDALYESGKADTLLLHEGVEVMTDVYNVLNVQSVNLPNSLRRQGYCYDIALLGILAKPREEFPLFPDAVEAIGEQGATVTERYDLSGRRIAAPVKGINIMRMSDGTVRKVHIR